MGQVSWRLVGLLLVGVSFLSGCGRKSAESLPATTPMPVPPEKIVTDQSQFLQAAEPFLQALARQKYEEAYGLLSSQAKSRMTLNQFVAPADALAFQRNEQSPFKNVTPADFGELMKKVEELYGRPQAVESLSVFSVDPDVLGHRPKEEVDILESAAAIGAIPDSISNDVRRASLHGQIATELSPDQLAHAATILNVNPDELQADPNFKPSFNVKLVLVEEDGQLKVGYFEFLPASRWT